MCLLKVFHLFASHTTGWDPNPNKFFTATVRPMLRRTLLHLTNGPIVTGRTLVGTSRHRSRGRPHLLLTEYLRHANQRKLRHLYGRSLAPVIVRQQPVHVVPALVVHRKTADCTSRCLEPEPGCWNVHCSYRNHI